MAYNWVDIEVGATDYPDKINTLGATVETHDAEIDALQLANTGDETTTRIGALINGSTAKTTPVDADMVGLMDSAGSNILKKLSWANIKSTIKTYFDTLYWSVTKTQPTGNVVGTTDTQTLTNKKVNGQKFKRNQSIASQAPAAATRTYITGTNLQFTAGELAVGTTFSWTFDVTKTAAGTAASTVDICLGTAGSTADTARVSFTKPAGTAVVDNGRFVIEAVVRSVGATCVISGHMQLTHNLSTTGLANIPCVNVTTISASFDVSTATNIGVCITTGASDAYTIQLVTAEAINL